MIPQNIKREHLLKAILEIDQNGVPKNAHSSTYDLVFEGKEYPPKLVVSLANKYANGELLNRSSFAGGEDTDAFKLLRKEGFEVITKQSNYYSWVTTHKELVKFLDKNRNEQPALIKLLTKAGVNVQNDKANYDTSIPLEEIDPFTFFCYIYIYGEKKRLKVLQNIADQLGISIPQDERGLPSADARKTWLFPYKYDRTNEIEKLWELFDQTLSNNLSQHLFEEALAINGIGKTKLTEALFYIDPDNFFPINGPSKLYLKEVLNIDPTFKTLEDYQTILSQIRNKSSKAFAELSYNSWEYSESKKKVNYWLFQGNPEVYNITKALKGGHIKSWKVSAHKDKIKKGDKVIIWQTGKQSGCYALADITSDVGEFKEKSYETQHYVKEPDNSYESRVKLKISHYAADSPLLWDELKNLPKLQDLNAGNRGTNFSASKSQFDTLKTLIENNTKTKKYWLYSPGENADQWEEFYKLGIIGLGWDELGNLSNYSSKRTLKAKLKELSEGTTDRRNDATANWDFAHSINQGDYIIVKKGRSLLLGYGIIRSDYYYDEARQEYKSCRKVDWICKGVWDPEKQLAIKTLTNITSVPSEVEKFDFLHEHLLSIIMNTPKQRNESISLNQLFYGPPGTGKTYNTVSQSAEIITGQKLDNYEKALEIFQKQLGNRIEFITFHQNYNYEDFIQGLRPDVENKELSFQRNDGLFTQVATHALFEYYKELEKQKLISSTENLKEPELAEVYAAYFKSLKKGQEFETKSGSSIQIVGFSKSRNVEYAHFENGRPYLVSQDRLLRLYDSFPEIDQIQKIHEDIRAAIGGCNTTVYYVALREFINFRSNYISEYHQEVSEGDIYDELMYDDISYDRKKELLSKTPLEQIRSVPVDAVPSYVLIVDEINRANISRVFGELITLLEPDKRSHGKLPLTCTLPSGERFIVPSNLYLIGTMNTADKSIALLDIALRRRFKFIPMYPNSKVEGVQRPEILEKINERIISLKTRDFTIGHSYFMGDDFNLKETIDTKIIPLLLEYFMNDEKEVIGILDFAGLEIGNWPLEFIKENGHD